jgi:predicted nuclease of predicted toxin-antitoxin system
MRFKVDENLPPEIVDVLHEHGHDAATVFEQGLRGKEDYEIAEVARQESRVVLSLDLDFSNILQFPPENYSGMIVLRLRNKSRQAVRAVVERVIQQLEHLPLVGRLWIVDEHRIRIRRVNDDQI